MNQAIKERIEKIKRGEVPEGYKTIGNIGIIPVEWPEGVLSEVLYHEVRAVPKPTNAYWRLGLRSHAKGTFHELVQDPETVDMEELFEVKENDLIVNITFAWEHAVAIASKEDEGKLVSHRFPTYVFNHGSSPQFFKYIVMQRWFRKLLENISPGGAGRNRVMSKPAFLKLPCYIPPLHEQEKIAEILSTWDKAILLMENLIEEKKKQKKWLMQNLLNPDSGVRLPGFEGEWKTCTINEICTVVGGGTPDTKNHNYWNGDIPWISSSDLIEGNIHVVNATRFITKEAIASSATQICPKDSILVVSRVGVGKVAIAPYELCTSQDFTNLTNVRENVHFTAVSLSQTIKNKMKYTQGTSIKGITTKEIKDIILRFPTIAEQTAIAKVLTTADHEIELLEQKRNQLQKQKKALMQLLLTGIVRVTIYSGEGR